MNARFILASTVCGFGTGTPVTIAPSAGAMVVASSPAVSVANCKAITTHVCELRPTQRGYFLSR